MARRALRDPAQLPRDRGAHLAALRPDFALIQRTQMLEKTLRTQLSPQMSAALRSRTLGSQVQ
jgi:hypothetical protein